LPRELLSVDDLGEAEKRLELPKTSIAPGNVFGNGILAFLETDLRKQL
jgi:hypothetical protein